MFCRCLFVYLLATLRKNVERICMKISGKVCSFVHFANEQMLKLNFGGDQEHRLDTGIVLRIRH